MLAARRVIDFFFSQKHSIALGNSLESHHHDRGVSSFITQIGSTLRHDVLVKLGTFTNSFVALIKTKS